MYKAYHSCFRCTVVIFSVAMCRICIIPMENESTYIIRSTGYDFPSFIAYSAFLIVSRYAEPSTLRKYRQVVITSTLSAKAVYID